MESKEEVLVSIRNKTEILDELIDQYVKLSPFEVESLSHYGNKIRLIRKELELLERILGSYQK
jgi:RNA binding exosome subunit